MHPGTSSTPDRVPFELSCPTLLVLVLALTTLLYIPGLHGPFLLDDWHNIRLGFISDFSWSSIRDFLKSGGGLPAERPLPFLTFALNLQLFGGASFSFKAVNLALHLVTGGLLYVLAHQVARLLLPAATRRRVASIAVIAACLWLIHPMHVSTVLYTVQRMAQMSAMFTVLALIAYLQARFALVERSNRKAALYLAGMAVASLAALGSKQNAALIPVFILAIEACCLSNDRSPLKDRQTTILAGLLGVVPTVLGIVAVVLLHDTILENYSRREFSLEQRMATELRILWDYAFQIALPRLGEFGIYQDDANLSDFGDVSTWTAMVGWIMAVSLGILWRRAVPSLLFLVLWFLSAHALESTFVPLELVFEHRNYLAIFGVTFFTACVVTHGTNTQYARLSATFLVGISLLLGLQTAARATTWKDYLTLTSVAVREHPESARARSAYSVALLKIGRVNEALEQLEVGGRLEPMDAGFLIARLSDSCAHGLPSDSAYEDAMTAVEERILTPYALNALDALQDNVLNDRCSNISTSQLLALHDTALNNAAARTNRRNHSSVHFLRGLLLANHLRRPMEAYEDFQRAIELYPKWQAPRVNQARILIGLNKPQRAIALIDKYLDNPEHLSPATVRALEDLRIRATERVRRAHFNLYSE